MIDYASLFNSSGAFPNTLAINITAPSAGDGTELIAAMPNDSWGWHQAMMDYGLNGVAPDTVTEAPGTSQMVEAMQMAFGLPGEVVGWHGQLDPAARVNPPRLLLLQGQGVLIASYPELDAEVYIGDANNPNLAYPFYFHATTAGGGTRNTAGPWLILADARGYVLRGDDITAIRDPDGASRKFPDIQADSLIQHDHDLITDGANFANAIGYTPPAGGGTPLFTGGVEGGTSLKTQTTEGVDNNADEVRMGNIQIKWCVRY